MQPPSITNPKDVMRIVKPRFVFHSLSRSGFPYIPVAERDFWRVFGFLVPFGDRDVLGLRPNPDLLSLFQSGIRHLLSSKQNGKLYWDKP